MERSIDAWQRVHQDVPHTQLTTLAVKSYTLDVLKTYDDYSNLLEDALTLRTGNCLTRAALSSITAFRLGGICAIPTIRSHRITQGRATSLHAYTTTIGNNGENLIIDQIRDVNSLKGLKPHSVGFAYEYLQGQGIIDRDYEGIAQVRYEGFELPVVYLGTASKEPFNQDVIGVETLFCGVDGLKSYLKTADIINANYRAKFGYEVTASSAMQTDQFVPRI